jgi:hypothetical protein
MSDSDISDRNAAAAPVTDDETSALQKPLATSYLPLWFLVAFVCVVACGVLTK